MDEQKKEENTPASANARQIHVHLIDPPAKEKKEVPFWKSLSFYKWFFGTALLAYGGFISKLTFDKHELRLAEKELNVKVFEIASDVYKSEGIVSNQDMIAKLKNEIDYLNFSMAFINTEESKNSINTTIKYLQNKIDTLVAKDSTRNALTESLSNDAIEDSLRLMRKIDRSDKELKDKMSKLAQHDTANWATKENSTFKSIDEFKKENNVFIQKLEEKTKVSLNDPGPMSLLNKGGKIVLNFSSDYLALNEPETFWFKQGYYVDCNYLRIGLNRLIRSGEEQIDVRLTYLNGKTETPLKPSVIIGKGKTFTLEHDNKRYLISFDYIGSAGKNPFTKAAYITVSTFQKKS